MDKILSGKAASWMPILFALMIGIALFSAVVTWMQKSCLLKLSNKIELSKNAAYFWALLSAPARFFNRQDSFILLSNMDASKKISGIITRDVIDIIFSVLSVIFYFIMMLRLDALMTLIIVALVLVSYFAPKAQSFIADKLKQSKEVGNSPDSYELSFREQRLSSYGLQSIETFKSTASETAFFQHLMDNKSMIVNASLEKDYEKTYSPVERMPEILFINALLLISALRIIEHDISVGTYLALSAYASAFFEPMNRVIGAREALAGYEKRLLRMNRSLETTKNPERPKRQISRLSGNIEFKNVSFEYDEGIPVINNLSFSIPSGHRVAIIGCTGAGKTTLLKLLLGLYTPTSGSVTIDGVDVSEIDRHLIANCIGCANQEIALFTESIRDNITLWDESVTETDIYRAANASGLHEYVTSLDCAYDCELQENGGNLSGGQRQLLEITRAFLYDPTIVLFDEAMRSLDAETAAGVENEIMRRGCTYIQVTHILSRIIRYDEIIVMDKGRIVAHGTHEELIRTSEYYAAIYQSESGRRL